MNKMNVDQISFNIFKAGGSYVLKFKYSEDPLMRWYNTYCEEKIEFISAIQARYKAKSRLEQMFHFMENDNYHGFNNVTENIYGVYFDGIIYSLNTEKRFWPVQKKITSIYKAHAAREWSNNPICPSLSAIENNLSAQDLWMLLTIYIGLVTRYNTTCRDSYISHFQSVETAHRQKIINTFICECVPRECAAVVARYIDWA